MYLSSFKFLRKSVCVIRYAYADISYIIWENDVIQGISQLSKTSYDEIRQDWASSGVFDTIKYDTQINSLPDVTHNELRKSYTIYERFRQSF